MKGSRGEQMPFVKFGTVPRGFHESESGNIEAVTAGAFKRWYCRTDCNVSPEASRSLDEEGLEATVQTVLPTV